MSSPPPSAAATRALAADALLELINVQCGRADTEDPPSWDEIDEALNDADVTNSIGGRLLGRDRRELTEKSIILEQCLRENIDVPLLYACIACYVLGIDMEPMSTASHVFVEQAARTNCVALFRAAYRLHGLRKAFVIETVAACESLANPRAGAAILREIELLRGHIIVFAGFTNTYVVALNANNIPALSFLYSRHCHHDRNNVCASANSAFPCTSRSHFKPSEYAYEQAVRIGHVSIVREILRHTAFTSCYRHFKCSLSSTGVFQYHPTIKYRGSVQERIDALALHIGAFGAIDFRDSFLRGVQEMASPTTEFRLRAVVTDDLDKWRKLVFERNVRCRDLFDDASRDELWQWLREACARRSRRVLASLADVLLDRRPTTTEGVAEYCLRIVTESQCDLPSLVDVIAERIGELLLNPEVSPLSSDAMSTLISHLVTKGADQSRAVAASLFERYGWHPHNPRELLLSLVDESLRKFAAHLFDNELTNKRQRKCHD